MNYVVLVKQVPDIKNVPREAWDWEKGTLKRSLLDNVCNELDKQAMAFAFAMREEVDGKVVALTMGPPFATEVLRYALSLGADVGVLLTDRKLGGADTAATAYPLARAITKIQQELFDGDSSFVVVSGMQSVDGDTAQVPAQIAEDLGISHAAYATSLHFEDGSLQVRRITRRGSEVVAPLSYPCLVTATEWTQPPFPSFGRTRWAHSQELHQWSAADIGADESRIGLAGSRTNVVRVFSPKEAGQKECVFENDLKKLVKMLKETYESRLVTTEKEEEKVGYRLPPGRSPDYRGDVWVYAEQEGGELNPACFELLGKATELAAQLDEKVGAVLIGRDVGSLSSELVAYGADRVYVAEHDLLDDFLPTPYTLVLSGLVEEYRPQMLLFSATPMGRELAPRVAYRSNSGLTADCTGLDIVDFKRGDRELTAVLMQTRPALGGNVMASIVAQNSTVQMSTVRPGVMRALEPDHGRKGELVEYVPKIDESDLGSTIVDSEIRPVAAEIKDAAIVVCGGGGCKTKEGFARYIPSLAESLGGFLGQEAMVGASRVAVESGFLDRSRQIGQTGQTVRPRVYVAAGVSGAVQHLSGMQNSDIILAINKDPNARIFKVADYGIVGNLEEVVPALVRVLDSEGSDR